jgi:hypothetical protein
MVGYYTRSIHFIGNRVNSLNGRASVTVAGVADPKPPGPRAWERAEVLVPQLVDAVPALVSDGAGPAFPPELLDGPAPPVDPADPAVAPLLAQIRGERPPVRLPWRRGRGGQEPAASPEAIADLAGWRLLARTDTDALFGAGRAPQLLTVAIRFDRRSKSWGVAAVTRDRPVRAARENVRASSWRLDPDHPPGPADTEARIIVTEQRRSGGSYAHGRFLEPDLHIGAGVLELTIFVSPLPVMGVQGANPETPVRIALPEPLGARQLVDGAIYAPWR